MMLLKCCIWQIGCNFNTNDVTDTSKLVKKTDFNRNIKESEKKHPNNDKYITTNDFDGYSGAMFD